MNFEETYLDKRFIEYGLGLCEPEPTLLANLRQDTLQSTAAPQMICGPIVGQLLHMLTKLMGAKKIIELGTFTGYSALYMASALPRDGCLITCEVDDRHATKARSYFERSPHGHKIDLRMGPALETLSTLEGPFDLAFIDADKKNYPNYFEALLPKMRPGGLIVVDNVLWGGRVLAPRDFETKAIDALNKQVHDDPRVEVIMLTIRDGLLLCRVKP